MYAAGWLAGGTECQSGIVTAKLSLGTNQGRLKLSHYAIRHSITVSVRATFSAEYNDSPCSAVLLAHNEHVAPRPD